VSERSVSRGGEQATADRSPVWLEWTMLILALLMLPLVIVEESASSSDVLSTAEAISAFIWVAFVAEYVFLLSRAPAKRTFMRAHWFDLMIILLTPPLVFWPTELDALRILRALRLVRVIAVAGRAEHTIRRLVRRGSLPYVLALSLFLMVIGGLTIHALEPDVAESVGDGIWWAVTTMSTVGYGDIAPKTLPGRILAGALMVLGVATFATLTAGIASLLIHGQETEMSAELKAISERLERIERALPRTQDPGA
jgi:voltage-gated potassium channel